MANPTASADDPNYPLLTNYKQKYSLMKTKLKAILYVSIANLYQTSRLLMHSRLTFFSHLSPHKFIHNASRKMSYFKMNYENSNVSYLIFTVIKKLFWRG